MHAGKAGLENFFCEHCKEDVTGVPITDDHGRKFCNASCYKKLVFREVVCEQYGEEEQH